MTLDDIYLYLFNYLFENILLSCLKTNVSAVKSLISSIINTFKVANL